ncbi:hypothetical protein IWZ03DRAFT_101926 [Phyllosticta citriasiana]|uniref:Uncharacterized protein n=1 Tax=Phyllosticta citriasiana TaxID=595635 RepID=A0ABR1KUE6_9PEZI
MRRHSLPAGINMWTIILFSRALLFVCAVRGVIAAPAADLPGVTSNSATDTGKCLPFDSSDSLYSLSVGARWTCNGGTNPSHMTYDREMKENARILSYGNAEFWATFATCQNVEKAYKTLNSKTFVAVHSFGPLKVGGKTCCYTMTHQFDVVFDASLGFSVPKFNPSTSQLVEGCSAPGGTACPREEDGASCSIVDEVRATICPIDTLEPNCKEIGFSKGALEQHGPGV